MAADKLLWWKFFPDNWLSDERLNLCSLGAQGLWIKLLCLMHKNVRRGCLEQANGNPLSNEQIARFAGCSTEEAAQLLQQLQTAGVYSVFDNGVIYSRRMVKDEKLRTVRAKSGRKGGLKSKSLLKQNNEQKSSKQASKVSPLSSCISSDGVGGCGGGEGGATPDFALTAEGLAGEWCFFCTRKAKYGYPRDTAEEKAPEFAEMLRLGHSPDVIQRAMRAPERNRSEQIFKFTERNGFDKPALRIATSNTVEKTLERRKQDEALRQQIAAERKQG
jgi:hypothetical protein